MGERRRFWVRWTSGKSGTVEAPVDTKPGDRVGDDPAGTLVKFRRDPHNAAPILVIVAPSQDGEAW